MGKGVDYEPVPDGVIPEARATVEDAIKYIKGHPEETRPETPGATYTHAAGTFAVAAFGAAARSPEEQRAALKKCAERLIKTYGPEIIRFMKPELRGALGLDLDK